MRVQNHAHHDPAVARCAALNDLPPSDDAALQVLSTLPPARFAFAYGSAIFPQAGVVHPHRRMLDLVLAVDDAEQWHAANLALNRAHYSLPMAALGPAAIAAMQRSSFGARVYYNTILPSAPNSRPFKYGVVCTRDLETDLCDWESLYLSGRMQKPIRVLSTRTPPCGLTAAMDTNLDSAAAAALLSLPEVFAERELYNAVAALSYTGDVRMSLAVEVRSKVSDIVQANLDRFRALYKPHASVAGIAHARGDGVWCRAVEAPGQARLLSRLPRHIRESVRRRLGISDGGIDAVAALDSARVGRAVVGAVATVVARSSIRQSLKGLATAGLGTSARYVAMKLSKSVRARMLSGTRTVLNQVQKV